MAEEIFVISIRRDYLDDFVKKTKSDARVNWVMQIFGEEELQRLNDLKDRAAEQQMRKGG